MNCFWWRQIYFILVNRRNIHGACKKWLFVFMAHQPWMVIPRAEIDCFYLPELVLPLIWNKWWNFNCQNIFLGVYLFFYHVCSFNWWHGLLLRTLWLKLHGVKNFEFQCFYRFLIFCRALRLNLNMLDMLFSSDYLSWRSKPTQYTLCVILAFEVDLRTGICHSYHWWLTYMNWIVHYQVAFASSSLVCLIS